MLLRVSRRQAADWWTHATRKSDRVFLYVDEDIEELPAGRAAQACIAARGTVWPSSTSVDSRLGIEAIGWHQRRPLRQTGIETMGVVDSINPGCCTSAALLHVVCNHPNASWLASCMPTSTSAGLSFELSWCSFAAFDHLDHHLRLLDQVVVVALLLCRCWRCLHTTAPSSELLLHPNSWFSISLKQENQVIDHPKSWHISVSQSTNRRH
jgi:hypothetical protein